MLRVLTPPEPIVVPDDLSGDYDEAMATAVIAAVTAAIDGPAGWLGRALGEQTLELSGRDFYQRDFPTDHHHSHLGLRLPCPPLIEVEAVTYLDANEVEQSIDETVYREADGRLWLRAGQAWPQVGPFPDAARVRYRAGYDGQTPDDGGTGDVPANARQAINISTQHILSISGQSLFLSLDSVEGIGERRYSVSDQATQIIETTCDRLLAGLKVYA